MWWCVCVSWWLCVHVCAETHCRKASLSIIKAGVTLQFDVHLCCSRSIPATAAGNITYCDQQCTFCNCHVGGWPLPCHTCIHVHNMCITFLHVICIKFSLPARVAFKHSVHSKIPGIHFRANLPPPILPCH